jgi:hypothetical protein
MRDDFCAFILTHGRPNNVLTYKTLERHGYTGKVYIIIDNEDKTASEYYKIYGDKVIMFDKSSIAKRLDEGDNFEDRRAILYARNACFDIAKDLGIKYFIELDDDYYWFGYRMASGGKSMKNIDVIFESLVFFLENSKIDSVAFSQGGDHIGGYDENKQVSRKAMNSFVCSTNRPFVFVGRINEDVNTYTRYGGVGKIFLTIMNIQLDQKDTQSNKGGMADLYLMNGTYVKSFYTVMYAPSCACIRMMGIHHPRLHHSISWNNAVPCIISEDYKKR